MKLYSTNNPKHLVSIEEAVLHSLPPDNGLYMPVSIPHLDKRYLDNLSQISLQEIAYHIASLYFKDSIPPEILKSIIEEAINFPAPVITIARDISILELFHGPTLAFKDFGARFMARIMNYFWRNKNEKLHILVATSGDTGGAVAAGFDGLDNIEVTILYPKGKVSDLQKSQLTTWADNIRAIELEGNFDDCQKLIKEAFLDTDINDHLNLSSANSINIARLIPQSFYYFSALSQIDRANNKRVSFVVPSGNFGNLTAGLFAREMGLPIHKMIAATNENKVFTDYIQSGNYTPQKAISTLSNAMDIGNPSNFSRIMDLYGSTWNKLKKDIHSYSFTDSETVAQILKTHSQRGYLSDPHTAVGISAAEEYIQNQIETTEQEHLVVLSTAHPIKFAKEMEDFISCTIPYPSTLAGLQSKKRNWLNIDPSFDSLKNLLLSYQQ